jgi:hypothetical protein
MWGLRKSPLPPRGLSRCLQAVKPRRSRKGPLSVKAGSSADPPIGPSCLRLRRCKGHSKLNRFSKQRRPQPPNRNRKPVPGQRRPGPRRAWRNLNHPAKGQSARQRRPCRESPPTRFRHTGPKAGVPSISNVNHPRRTLDPAGPRPGLGRARTSNLKAPPRGARGPAPRLLS